MSKLRRSSVRTDRGGHGHHAPSHGRVLTPRRAASILLFAWVLAGCNQASPSTAPPEPSASSQPVAGNGWTLLRTVSPTLVFEGVAVAPLGADQYLVSLTVSGAGSGGCASPTFTGFQAVGTTLVAQFTRSPAPETCAVISAVTFYVALDRLTLQRGVDRIGTNQPCEGVRCTAPIPADR